MQALFFLFGREKKWSWKYFYALLSFSLPKLAFYACIFRVFLDSSHAVFTVTFSLSFTGKNGFIGKYSKIFTFKIFFIGFLSQFPQQLVFKKNYQGRILRKRTKRWGPSYILHQHSRPAQLFFLPILILNMHCTLSSGTLSRRVWEISLLEAK